MDAPPYYDDPTMPWVGQTQNVGAAALWNAWSYWRDYWGTAMGQAYTDLQLIVAEGVPV
jgi:hypothetical protein